MLQSVSEGWTGETPAAAAVMPAIGEGVEDRRFAERAAMKGAEVYMFLDDEQRFCFRLRDLGTHGMSGLTDAPLSEGETVIIQLEEMLMPAAQVVWVRRASAGLIFINPLPIARFRRIIERQEKGAAWSPAMRAGSDLHGWWTDAAEQSSERKPRLRAGGHKKPLPRLIPQL